MQAFQRSYHKISSIWETTSWDQKKNKCSLWKVCDSLLSIMEKKKKKKKKKNYVVQTHQAIGHMEVTPNR